MVRRILPGTGDTGHSMAPFIPFNMIVDTDVGLLSLILKSYMDPKIFNKDFFFDKKVIDLVREVYNRRKENPLYPGINEEYIYSCDSLYEEFMKDHYDEILDLSVVTEFYRLVGAYHNDSDINVLLVCEREEEIDILKEYKNTKNCEIILADSLTPSKIKESKQFFFKSIPDVIPYSKYLADKTIYFADYGFNKTDDGGFIPDALLDALVQKNGNIINKIDVFNREKLKE